MFEDEAYSPESRFNRYQMETSETKPRNSAYDDRSDVITPREILSELSDAPAGAGGGHNLLVVSDLHLGDSLRPSDPGYLKNLARLNRALCRFLKHYAKNSAGGRPWRLVIAGDMIDFLHAGLFQSQSLDPARGASRESAPKHGSELAAIDWLEQVMVRERRVFRLLASFVGAGHDLVIIKGNHDAQFHFEGVQKRFTELLLELHVRRLLVRRRVEGAEADLAQEICAFTRRISFCRWFYYERDLVYIEHGNQYDAFCSFEHVLSPIYPDHFELEDPISHRTYREFANLLGSLDVHSIDQWKLFDYARWVAGLGPKLIGRLAYTYFASISWLVRTKRRLLQAARKAREEHLLRRKVLTRSFGLTDEIVHALDELRERPAGTSVFSGINMLYMDRVALAGLDLVAIGLAFAVSGPALLRAGVALGVVLLSLVAHGILERFREVDPNPKLAKMAREVARLMRVPFVVFGHTHRPTMEAAPACAEQASSWYFNTGSWTHAGEVGLTHVCILRNAGEEGSSEPEPRRTRAELRRWCLDSHRPLRIDEPAFAERG